MNGMNLKKVSYPELAKNIRERNSRIFIYGAGMIGQIVVPYILDAYGLHDYVECYVDKDERKTGKSVVIREYEYEIRLPEVFNNISENSVVLLTNSKFYPVLEFLNGMANLENVDCYIIPIMQLALTDKEQNSCLNIPAADTVGALTGREQRNTNGQRNTNVQRNIKEQIIPKKIHYCWFGGKELPDFLKKCMESWSRCCPDYEILRWDESNFDIHKHEYTRQAAVHQKWGFVTDVARLDILYQYGGIYLDTDVKLLKSLDGLLYRKGFVGVEKWGNINSGGGIGAVPHHPMIREMLDYRLAFPFVMSDGSLNYETNGFYETMPFIRHGMRIDNTLQLINDMTVYPASVFHPYDYLSCEEKIKEHTVSVHYFYGGWMEEEDRGNREKTQCQYGEFLKCKDSV